MVCFVRFDFDVCFPPQPYAFFQQVNCSEPKPYLLRATTACNFLIYHPTRWLCTRSFSEPTFRPSGATKHWQNTVIRDFFTFWRTLLFFLLTYSLLWSSFFSLSLLWLFPPLLLHLSILSEVWLLNCLRTYFLFGCFILLRSAVCLWGHNASWGQLGHEVD